MLRWNKDVYEKLMKDKSDAIGSNIQKQKFEYFREINFAGVLENDADVNKLLGMEEKARVLIRNYFMWNGGKRICVIQEYFSNEVKKALSIE